MADLGDGRRAIVRHKPEQSELVRRITAGETSLRMPPVYSGRELTKAEIERLTEWIAQGAPWEQHWAFAPPVRPPELPVKNQSWVRNPIDSFVLARLEREGWQPSPEAGRATLIRRVTKLGGIFYPDRKRLLAKDMLALGDRVEGDLLVSLVWCADQDRVAVRQ